MQAEDSPVELPARENDSPICESVHASRVFTNNEHREKMYDPRDGALPTCTGLVRLHVHREERMCVKKGIAGLKPPAAPK